MFVTNSRLKMHDLIDLIILEVPILLRRAFLPRAVSTALPQLKILGTLGRTPKDLCSQTCETPGLVPQVQPQHVSLHHHSEPGQQVN